MCSILPKTDFALYLIFNFQQFVDQHHNSPNNTIAADGALALRPLSEHASCPPRVYIHVPTILTEKGPCVIHCLCENKLHSESTPGPALAAWYFLARPGQAR